MTARRYVGLLALAVLMACDVPAVQLVRREDSNGGSASTGFQVHAALDDSALASALGWSAGVPATAVVIHRYIDPYQPDTVYTDATGDVTIPNLLPGWYLVAGFRRLDASETGPTGGVIRAFADALKHELTARDTVLLTLTTDRPGSLVFSELYYGGSTRDIQYNSLDDFFELYNNADTTVYVDGMVLGRAYSFVGSADPCVEHAQYRDDPQGVWSRAFHQFPGSGTEYPVLPGRVVTIAMDAADHSQAYPSLPDLSHADFELEGTADADNPDVPNMPAPYPSAPRDHGMPILSVAAYFLASAVDVAALQTQLIDGYRYARFPADRILDAASTDEANPGSQPPFPRDEYCSWINPEFDRLETFYFRLGSDPTSLSRRILRTGSKTVLQDLDASLVDWVLGPYSPGQIQP